MKVGRIGRNPLPRWPGPISGLFAIIIAFTAQADIVAGEDLLSRRAFFQRPRRQCGVGIFEHLDALSFLTLPLERSVLIRVLLELNPFCVLSGKLQKRVSHGSVGHECTSRQPSSSFDQSSHSSGSKRPGVLEG